jgi:hypothetical protein
MIPKAAQQNRSSTAADCGWLASCCFENLVTRGATPHEDFPSFVDISGPDNCQDPVNHFPFPATC